ncbi:hypothetical protein [Mesorhizobium sp.]|uniref:hypothetical protein n=1 Tax=Mesorhizobium sp. TaxID=1871066 RepID=UPI000FE5F510|nr:hypothetical protein [Mesorhizobium sp.]RWI35495.1 MAG: hypothetical protein EOR14_28750 [Mesorhizobium sp.]RWJ66336.1 MAG: hypothetical protein EOR34_28385 [Mesorhizobium sp.]
MNIMNTLHGKELKIEERNLIDRHGNRRVGNYMATSTGYKYWPFDPKPEEIYIEAIAHHLATKARWAGATQHRRFKSRIFFAVAEHSVYVADYVRDVLKRPDLELEALLHDAPEYVIGDLIRPLKYSPSFRAPFLELEDLNEAVVAKRFNLVHPFPREIKIADEAVTEAEHQQIIFWHPDEGGETVELHETKAVANIEIKMLEPYPAKEFFLDAYYNAIARREEYRPLPQAFRV